MVVTISPQQFKIVDRVKLSAKQVYARFLVSGNKIESRRCGGWIHCHLKCQLENARTARILLWVEFTIENRLIASFATNRVVPTCENAEPLLSGNHKLVAVICRHGSLEMSGIGNASHIASLYSDCTCVFCFCEHNPTPDPECGSSVLVSSATQSPSISRTYSPTLVHAAYSLGQPIGIYTCLEH